MRSSTRQALTAGAESGGGGVSAGQVPSVVQ